MFKNKKMVRILLLLLIAVFVVNLYCGCHEINRENMSRIQELESKLQQMEREKNQQQINELNKQIEELKKQQ